MSKLSLTDQLSDVVNPLDAVRLANNTVEYTAYGRRIVRWMRHDLVEQLSGEMGVVIRGDFPITMTTLARADLALRRFGSPVHVMAVAGDRNQHQFDDIAAFESREVGGRMFNLQQVVPLKGLSLPFGRMYAIAMQRVRTEQYGNGTFPITAYELTTDPFDWALRNAVLPLYATRSNTSVGRGAGRLQFATDNGKELTTVVFQYTR